MSDMRRATAFTVGTVIVLFVVMVIAAVTASAGVWHQSYARASADAVCKDGWYPSWAQWPNDGTGGWVCNREADDPSVPVAVASGGGSTPTPTPTPGLPTAWVTISGGTMFMANGAISDPGDFGVAPPCATGTLEIRVTAPLTVSLIGAVPQTIIIANQSGADFTGAFSVDTRCV